MEIKHNPERQKFTISLDGKEAVLFYRLEGKIMDILKVKVPAEFRGMGLAEKITLHVFNYAKEKCYRIISTCSYTKNKFLKDHKEFDNLLK